jgi:hypothetical protein
VSDKFWCDGVAFDYSILWMSHVHEILWEIILLQEKISICCVVLVNQQSFGRHRGCVVAFVAASLYEICCVLLVVLEGNQPACFCMVLIRLASSIEQKNGAEHLKF